MLHLSIKSDKISGTWVILVSVLAGVEKNLALAGLGEEHWGRAEDYLQKYYSALKERVA